jgi:hypothetical protein
MEYRDRNARIDNIPLLVLFLLFLVSAGSINGQIHEILMLFSNSDEIDCLNEDCGLLKTIDTLEVFKRDENYANRILVHFDNGIPSSTRIYPIQSSNQARIEDILDKMLNDDKNFIVDKKLNIRQLNDNLLKVVYDNKFQFLDKVSLYFFIPGPDPRYILTNEDWMVKRVENFLWINDLIVNSELFTDRILISENISVYVFLDIPENINSDPYKLQYEKRYPFKIHYY